MNFLKRQVPLIIVFTMGVIFIVQYFIPHQWSQDVQTWVNKWIVVIGGGAPPLGGGRLVYFPYARGRRRGGGGGFNVIVVVGFGAGVIACFLPMLLEVKIGDSTIVGGTKSG